MRKEKMIWGYLIHLGMNMWREADAPKSRSLRCYTNASDVLRFDKVLWDELLGKMADAGVNTLVIDLGEGVQYESHPEIAVKGSWSVDLLRQELARIRELGINPIPKLNFSTTHDAWLGDYAKAVSSKKYYEVCKDLILEVIDIFDKPDLFHIGMDEETIGHHRYNNYVVLRQGDYWWKDFYFYVDILEKEGVRPWIWSDYIWNHEEEFLKKMPKSVLQSNWYYGDFPPRSEHEALYVKAYETLAEHGFDQVPTGSNWGANCDYNFEATVEYFMENINMEKVKGFLQAPWKPTVLPARYRHYEAIEHVSDAIKIFESDK
ncbi:MAG: Tat pathway signal protein [Caldicoprobacterales bacterium]|jgi:hypothetical protein|nr:Tat pathway signal protein [Clostridiales bacterium]